MSTYKTAYTNAHTPNPSVFVSIKKNRLKHHQDSNIKTVYLNDKDEFELEIFNPTTNTIRSDISINNKFIGSLVLDPGERVFLDRYIEENKKFQFKTYKVENVEEVLNAIENNGLIIVKFYTEVTHYPTREWGYSGNLVWTSNNYTTGSPTITYKTNYQYTDSTTTDMLRYDDNISFTYTTDMIETGRINKGGESHQQLVGVDKDFANVYFHKETIQLLPHSRTKHFNQIKTYCSGCGRRFRKNDNFCPQCGIKR